MASGLDAAFLLDRRWHWMMGEMESTKQPTLALLSVISDEARLEWALIGGVALQAHRREPRTTLDIDVAVAERSAITSARLEAEGFRRTGRFEHSENWISSDGVPVQFRDDPALGALISRAESFEVGGVTLRVARRLDLLREKLRASADPARRRSKRLQDLGDAVGLIEDDPALRAELTPEQIGIIEG